MKEKALQYLEKDPLLFADMVSCIQKGSANIFYADSDGVLLTDKFCGISMFACETEETGKNILSRFVVPDGHGEGRRFIVSHGEAARNAVGKTYSLVAETICYQVVYEREKIDVSAELVFKKADKEEARIAAEYDLETPEGIHELVSAGKIWCAYEKNGKFVGFIGRHPEGSMGLLLIFPEFRRKGYAYALEAHQINEILGEGLVPYAHIVEGNDKSLALQKKLGFSVASEKVFWQNVR